MDKTLEHILTLLPKKEDGSFTHGAKIAFAQSIGLKNGNLVSDWIRGRTNSYVNYLYEIAAKYGVSVEWLRGETDDPTPTSAPESAARQLDRMIDNMSREELAALIVRASELLRDK